jgi:hypothetical protein
MVQDIKGSWKKLGSGSFGNVYKGAFIIYFLYMFERGVSSPMLLQETISE